MAINPDPVSGSNLIAPLNPTSGAVMDGSFYGNKKSECMQLPPEIVPQTIQRLYIDLTQCGGCTFAGEGDRKRKMDRVKKGREMYNPRRKRRNKPWPNASDCTLPVIKYTTNRLIAQRKGTLFSEHPFFNVTGSTLEDEKYVENVQRFLEGLVTEVFSLEEEYDPIALADLRDSVAPVKIEWEQRVKMVRKRTSQFNGEKFVWKTEVQPQVVKDQPTVKYIPIDRFGVFPVTAMNAQDATGVFCIMPWNGSDLLEFRDQGLIDGDALAYVQNYYLLAQSQTLAASTVKQEITFNLEPINTFHARIYDIHVLYWQIPIDKDKPAEDWLIWYHWPSRTILRAVPNPYWDQRRPFEISTPFPDTEGIYGDSIPDLIGEMADTMDTFLRMAIDQSAIEIHPPLAVDVNQLKNPDDVDNGLLVYGPGNLWQLNSVDAVKPIMMPSRVQVGTSLIEFCRSYVERMSGVSDNAMGMQVNHSQTATETQSLASNASMLFSLIIDRDRRFLTKVANQLLLLCYEYAGNPTVQDLWTRLVGNEECPFTSANDALGGRYHFTCSGSTENANKELKRALMQQIFAALMQTQLIQSDPLKQYALAKVYLKTMGLRVPEEIIGAEQEIRQAVASQAQAKVGLLDHEQQVAAAQHGQAAQANAQSQVQPTVADAMQHMMMGGGDGSQGSGDANGGDAGDASSQGATNTVPGGTDGNGQ